MEKLYRNFCKNSSHEYISSSNYFYCSDSVCTCERSDKWYRKFSLNDYAMKIIEEKNYPKIVCFEIYENDWREDLIRDYFIFIGGKYISCAQIRKPRDM